jgi:hypothetical protein
MPEAGSIWTRLSFATDDSGYDKWARKNREAEAKAKDDIVRKARIETDERSLAQLEDKLVALEKKKRTMIVKGELDRDSLRALEREMDTVVGKMHKVSVKVDEDRTGFARLKKATNETHQGFSRLGKAINDTEKSLFVFSTRVPLVGMGVMIQGLSAAIPLLTAFASSLAPIVGLLGVIPGLVATAGGAILTAGLGMRGIGDAIGEAWQGQNEAATKATAASKQAVAGARQVAGAERNIAEAERDIAEAHRDAKTAQEDLNEAREDATRQLQDLRAEVEAQADAERGGELAILRAERELGRIQAERPRDALALAQARLDVRDAERSLSETRREGRRNAEDLRKTEAGGVEQMEQVVSAREALHNANRRVADSQRRLRREQQDLAQEQKDLAQTTQEAAGATDSLKEKMADLSPAGRSFVRFVVSELFPVFKDLRNIAQEGLLPGVERGLRAAMQNLPVLRNMVRDYADALGDAAEAQGRFFGSRQAGRDLGNIFGQGETMMRRFTQASLNLSRAFLDIGVAARPLIMRLGRISVSLTDAFADWAERGRRSGELQAFFRRAIDATETFVRATWDLGRALVNIGSIARRVWGRDMLHGIADAMRSFREWTESVQGAREIEAYFERWRRRWRMITEILVDFFKRFRDLRKDGLNAWGAFIQALGEEIARSAGSIALAFINGFLGAGAWGRFVLGVWFLRRLGLLGKAFGFGAGIGKQFLAGFLASVGAGGLAARVMGGGAAAGAAGGAAGGTAARGAAGAGLGGAIAANPLGAIAVLTVGTLIAANVTARPGRTDQGLPNIRGMQGVIGRTGRETSPLAGDERALSRFGRSIELVFDNLRKAPTRQLEALRDRARELAKTDVGSRFEKELGRVEKALDRLLNHRALKERGLQIRNLVPGATQDELEALERSFDRLGATIPDSIRELRGNLRVQTNAISRVFERGSQEWKDAMANNAREGVRALGRSMREGRIDTGVALKEMLRLTRRDTGASKEVLKDNYRAMAEEVRKSMDKSGKVTERGLRIINEMFIKELKLYGFTQRQAYNVSRGQSPSGGPEEGGAQRAMGRAEGGFAPEGFAWGGRVKGFLGKAGERGKDLVHAILGRGEAVLNHPQQKIVNLALRTVGVGGLPDLFRRTKGQTHSGGMEEGGYAEIPAFAPGGYVPAAGGPSNTAGGVMGSGRGFNVFMRAVQAMFGRGPYVFSGLRPGDHTTSGALSNHATGNAIDITHLGGEHEAGPPGMTGRIGATMDRLHSWMGANIMPKIGRDFLWRTFTGGNHWNHIHMGANEPWAHSARAMMAFLRGVPNVKGIGGGIPNLKVTGPAGALRSIMQRVLDIAGEGAEERLAEQAAAFNPYGGTPPFDGGKAPAGTATRAQMVAWATEALHRTGHGASPEAIEKLLTLAMAESSWQPRSINLWDSNAAAGNPSGGLMHVTIDKVGGKWPQDKWKLWDPITNMMASIRYQFERYGGLVTHSPYGEGGIAMEEGGFPKGADDLLYIGDSLGVGTFPHLERMMPNWDIRGSVRGSRQPDEGADLVRSLINQRHDGVIFDLGTNGPPAMLRSAVRSVKNRIGKRLLFMATVNDRDPGSKRAKNSIIRGAGAHIIPWAERGSTISDGIHASPSGYRARAGMFKEAINRLRGRSGSEAPAFPSLANLLGLNDPVDSLMAGGGYAGLPFAGYFKGGGTVGVIRESFGPRVQTRGERLEGWVDQVEKMQTRVERLDNQYSLAERGADLTEEEYIDEGEVDDETGAIIRPPSFNVDQIKRRITEIDKLVKIRNKMLSVYIGMQTYLQMIVQEYKRQLRKVRDEISKISNQIRGLGGSREDKRRRNRLQGRLGVLTGAEDDIKTNLDTSQDTLSGVLFDIGSTKLDIQELLNEKQPLAATLGLGPGAGLTLPTLEGPEAAEAAGVSDLETAQRESTAARDRALAEQGKTAIDLLRTISSTGDIGHGYLNAFHAATNPMAVPPYAPGGTGGGLTPALAGAGTTFIQNNYMLQPDDPAVLAGVANAAVGGFSQQPFRPSTTESHNL